MPYEGTGTIASTLATKLADVGTDGVGYFSYHQASDAPNGIPTGFLKFEKSTSITGATMLFACYFGGKHAYGYYDNGVVTWEGTYATTSDLEAKVGQYNQNFDFNNTSYQAGFYRLHSGNNNTILNAPFGKDMSYGNVSVIRNKLNDTLTMLAFPYNRNEIYFRSGSTASFATNEWREIVTKSDLAQSLKYSMLYFVGSSDRKPRIALKDNFDSIPHSVPVVGQIDDSGQFYFWGQRHSMNYASFIIQGYHDFSTLYKVTVNNGSWYLSTIVGSAGTQF